MLNLKVARIVVCGHTHCGGIRALYEDPPAQAVNLKAWLELGREAALPVQVTEEALRRTEQRAIVLQLERLMGYPMVRERVEAGGLALHGWHYVIEDGEVHVFDVKSGQFVAGDALAAQRHRSVCAVRGPATGAGFDSPARVAATLQARHRAPGGPHPQCDFMPRHAGGGSSGHEICHQDSEYAVPEQGALFPAVVTRERRHREPAGQWCRRLRHEGTSPQEWFT